MRRFPLVAFLMALLAAPALAAATGALPFDLTFSPSPPPEPIADNGTVSGKVGNVPVQGTYFGSSSSGALTLTVDSATFADGTYDCRSGGCTFTGTVAGRPATFTTSPQIAATSTPTSTTVSGTAVSSAFRNHGAWVSSVAHWSQAHLTGRQVGQIVSDAAHSKTRGIETGARGPAEFSSRDRGGGHGGHGGDHAGDHGRGHD